MGNHAGHQLTVLQRYWKVPVPVYMTLQNIFRQILRQRNKQYKYTDKISKTAHLGGFCLSVWAFCDKIIRTAKGNI